MLDDSARCASCGAPMGAQDAYCGRCGMPRAATPPPASSGAAMPSTAPPQASALANQASEAPQPEPITQPVPALEPPPILQPEPFAQPLAGLSSGDEANEAAAAAGSDGATEWAPPASAPAVPDASAESAPETAKPSQPAETVQLAEVSAGAMDAVPPPGVPNYASQPEPALDQPAGAPAPYPVPGQYPPPPPGYASMPGAYPPPPMYPPPVQYPPPGYAPAYPGQPVVVQVQQPSSGPVIAEAILGLFGIFGVGWLAAGKTTPGAVLLGLSVLWWIGAVVVVVVTLGLGACAIVPLDILFVVLSAVNLNNAIRRG